MNIDSNIIVAVLTVLAVAAILVLRRMGGSDSEKDESEQNRRS